MHTPAAHNNSPREISEHIVRFSIREKTNTYDASAFVLHQKVKTLLLYYKVEIIHYTRVYIENDLYFLIDTRNFRFLKAITAKKTLHRIHRDYDLSFADVRARV